MSQLNYRLKSQKSQGALEQKLLDSGKYESMEKLKVFCQSLAGGAERGIFEVAEDSDAATGDFTIASSGAQSVTIAGSTLTGGTDYDIANLSASQIAANLADAINDSSDGNVQLVDAEASGAAVTVTCKVNGLLGNQLAISATGAASASGTELSDGTSGSMHVLDFNLAR